MSWTHQICTYDAHLWQFIQTQKACIFGSLKEWADVCGCFDVLIILLLESAELGFYSECVGTESPDGKSADGRGMEKAEEVHL